MKTRDVLLVLCQLWVQHHQAVSLVKRIRRYVKRPLSNSNFVPASHQQAANKAFETPLQTFLL